MDVGLDRLKFLYVPAHPLEALAEQQKAAEEAEEAKLKATSFGSIYTILIMRKPPK